MSQRQNLEACFVKHNQAFESVHKKFTEQINAASGEVLRQALKTIANYLEIEHPVQSSKKKSAFDELARTLHETEVAVHDATRQSLEDKDIEITRIRQEYEAKLQEKDDEIKTLKETVHDLRESRQDKADMIAMTKEMNKLLLSQLQEQKEPYHSDEDNMLSSMSENKKEEAELQVQNLEAGLQKKLSKAHKKSQGRVIDRGSLSEQVEVDAQTIDDPMETIVTPVPYSMNRKQRKRLQEHQARELHRFWEESAKAEDLGKFVRDAISRPSTKWEPYGRF